MSARQEFEFLVEQARRWAELDQMFGVETAVLPAMAPLALPAVPVATAPLPAAPVAAALPVALVAPAPVADPALEARRAENRVKLEAIARRLDGCTLCALSRGRTNLVPGQGDPAAELVFVGEGPGETEDQTGLAFVGRAGELLTKMIVAMKLTREEVFIANVVKCRPPGNRPPVPDEMATCLPFLDEQLSVIKPRVICALGKTAAIGLGLLRPGDALGSVRGRFAEWRGTPVMVTYHPSYLLRTPGDKKKAWDDLQKIFPYLTRRPAG